MVLIDLFGQYPPVLSEERRIFGSPEVVQNESKMRGNNDGGVLRRRVLNIHRPAHRSPRECGAAMKRAVLPKRTRL